MSKTRFVRISKQKARKLFNEDQFIWFCPCKLYPEFPFNSACIMDKKNHENFDKAINRFVHVNCSYEAGYYPHYYLEKEIK